MDIDEAFRESNDEAIIAHINEDYDTKNDPDKLLRLAAHYGREKVIAACLEAGIVPDSHGALCWACGEGQMRPIKMLISAGANINLRDDWGRAPITQSAGHGKLNQVKYLLKQGARIDGALSAAVDGEYTKLVEFLVTQGANIEEQGDGKLFTPLMSACAKSHKKADQIALFLINAGANVNYMRVSDEMTPLKFAAAGSTAEVIQALIDHGAEVNGPAGTDQTPLMHAARANNVPAIDVLLRNGADPNLRCGLPWAEGRTAEGLAELENRSDAFNYLRAMRESSQ